MQTLNASILTGVVPIRFPIIQSVAKNQWIDVNNESAVTLTVSLGGRIYLIPPHTTARYAMDNTETFVTFTPNSAANGTTDTVSGTVYNVQDSVPVEVERGASASDILPITSAMIADGAVTAAKVATNAINAANIVAGAVGNSQLASLAVANANIQANAVQANQIASGAVTTTKIANLAVTTALIAGAAVGTAQIANAAITTALIANLAVTDALISDLSASKITAGTISATISITSPTITGGTYQTASSGRRVNIDASVDVSRMRFFTGGATETSPGFLAQTGTAPNTSLVLSAPVFSSGSSASFQVNSGNTIDVSTAQFRVNANSAVSVVYGVGSVISGSFPGVVSVLPKIQSGTVVATSSAAGDITINFPNAFPNGVIAVVAVSGDVASFGGYFARNSITTSAAVFRAMHNDSNPAVSQIMRCDWLAIGW